MISSKELCEALSFFDKCVFAIELIRDKKVDVDLLLLSDSVKDYNERCHKYINLETKLTKKEFNFLKEIFS